MDGPSCRGGTNDALLRQYRGRRGEERGCCAFLLSADEILISVSKWDGTMERKGRSKLLFYRALALVACGEVTLCEQMAEYEGLLKEGKSVSDSGDLTPKTHEVSVKLII